MAKNAGSDLARTLLRLAAFGAVAVLAFTAAQRWTSLSGGDIPAEYLLYYVLPLGSAAALLFALSLAPRDVRATAVPSLAACVVGIYAAEIYLQLSGYDNRTLIAEAAAKSGNAYDPRTVDEVVAELRGKGVDAHPFMRILNRRTDPMPLANTPARTIVWCNERGRNLVYRSDRHGLNNPDAIWDAAPVDIAVVGDSFVQGACAPDNDGMVDRLRRTNPSVANLGIGGNAPQSNLATLVEYAPALRPRRIVWVHYAGNDLSGMMQDVRHPVLSRYVDEPGFTQRLAARDGEIVRLMDDFFANEYAGTNRYELSPLELMIRKPLLTLKLTALRLRLGITHFDGATVDFDLLERTFARAKALADGLGAELSVITLPHALQAERPLELPEVRLREIVQRLGIFHLDAGAEMRRRGEPAKYYVFGRNGGHLSAEGDALLAELIAAAADRRQTR